MGEGSSDGIEQDVRVSTVVKCPSAGHWPVEINLQRRALLSLSVNDRNSVTFISDIDGHLTKLNTDAWWWHLSIWPAEPDWMDRDGRIRAPSNYRGGRPANTCETNPTDTALARSTIAANNYDSEIGNYFMPIHIFSIHALQWDLMNCLVGNAFPMLYYDITSSQH